jgi:DNA adenine methylase
MSFREVDQLWQVVDRLRGVQIECRDAFDVIRACDRPTTLFYLDPPYVHGTRSKWRDVYAHEMTDEDHVRLARLARSLEGYCLISGYPSELYREEYENHGWQRVETKSRTNGGRVTSVERIEALWISPRTWEMHLQEERERMSQDRQLPLFSTLN